MLAAATTILVTLATTRAIRLEKARNQVGSCLLPFPSSWILLLWVDMAGLLLRHGRTSINKTS